MGAAVLEAFGLSKKYCRDLCGASYYALRDIAGELLRAEASRRLRRGKAGRSPEAPSRQWAECRASRETMRSKRRTTAPTRKALSSSEAAIVEAERGAVLATSGWIGPRLALKVHGPPDAVTNASLPLGQLVALDMEWTG
jgi:hypothetical protein